MSTDIPCNGNDSAVRTSALAPRRSAYRPPALRRFGSVADLTRKTGCTATALLDRGGNFCVFAINSKTR